MLNAICRTKLPVPRIKVKGRDTDKMRMAGLKVGRVSVTNLDRVIYPELHVAKKEVIEYYIRIAPRMLPFLADRPLVMQRFPDGVDFPGFYEKDAPQGTPPWVRLHAQYSETPGREIRYVVCDDPDTLVWLANLAALELNIMLYRTDAPAVPDMLLFDLDPEPPAGFPEATASALLLREVLDELGLPSFPKTSGKKGIHVVTPLVREYSFDQTRNFVHAMGILLAKRSPLIVSERSQTNEPGTVLIDYLQNVGGKTMISPYSLRATPEATVSMPLSWQEVRSGIAPEDFTIFTASSRRKDPWEGFFDTMERLPEARR
jgi:bifunctional non-homologous end joining protein LigD